MERHRALASMIAALLVGAAVVLLWPEPEPGAPAPHPQPLSQGERGAAEEQPVEPVAEAPPPPPNDTELRAHLAAAPDLWLTLAELAEASDEPATRALAPELRALAEQAPALEPHPTLQPTAAFLLAELRMAERLEGSGMILGEQQEELDTLVQRWLGTAPMAPAGSLR